MLMLLLLGVLMLLAVVIFFCRGLVVICRDLFGDRAKNQLRDNLKEMKRMSTEAFNDLFVGEDDD